MNTVQIVNTYKRLEDEKNELRNILTLLADNGYKGSKAYVILENSFDEKKKEFLIFTKKVWVDE